MNGSWILHEHFMVQSSWTTHEQFMNGSWTWNEPIHETTTFMNSWWTPRLMKYTWTVHGTEFINNTWTVHELFLNMKWAYSWNYNIHEQLMNSSTHEVYMNSSWHRVHKQQPKSRLMLSVSTTLILPPQNTPLVWCIMYFLYLQSSTPGVSDQV